MPRWLPRVLTRVHEFAAQQKVRLTLKARRELAGLGLGLDHQDAVEVLANLAAEDSHRRDGCVREAGAPNRLRGVVVSFHEEGDDHDLEDEA